MGRVELNILGCGSAKPTLIHHPSCQVLNVHDKLFMIDCGEGAQTMLMKMGLKWSRLSHIFISHLHGDHCFGLLGLLSTMGLQNHGGEIVIHTIRDGITLFKAQTDYFCREMPFKITFDEISVGHAEVYADDAVTISTFPLKHRVPTVGFLFEERQGGRHINGEMARFHGVPIYFMNNLRAGEDFVKPDGTVIANELLTTTPTPAVRYAYVSDTMPAEKYLPYIEGVDWLYHESTYASEHAADAKARFHSTAAQAAEVARKVGAKNLILGHYSSRYRDESVLLNEARAIFPSTILSNEGMKIPMSR